MSIFDEVKAQTDITQVVEFYGYPVNKKGQFACPFHNDTHPSASIKKGKNYFNCFVCGAGGDAISFVSKLYNLRNIDAAKRLINDFKLNIDIEPQDARSRLRADRARQKMAEQRRERESLESMIDKTGYILADFHRYCFQGIKKSGQWLVNACQYMAQAEYYLEEYDDDPKGFTLNNRKLVKEIERRLYKWNNER